MIAWVDEGIVLGGRLYGESALIVEVLTRAHGRRAGFVHGGQSRSRRAVFETGNTLALDWATRREDELGRFQSAEPLAERAGRMLDMPAALSAIASVGTLLRETLQEGDAHAGLFEATTTLLDALEDEEIWPALYVRWETGLLGALGYGLDLERCALTGDREGLSHVSPRTGRAVRGSAAEDYVERLLPLPGFLVGAREMPGAEAVGQGLRLTGYFLEHRVFQSVFKPVPQARYVLMERMATAGLAA